MNRLVPDDRGNKFQRFLHFVGRASRAEILVSQQFQNPRRDVGAFRIEHGIVIRKRNFFQNAFRAILVERCPATVATLKRHHPVQSPIETCNRAARDYLSGFFRRASSTMAVSSTSGFHLLLNSKTQPLGSTSAGFL